MRITKPFFWLVTILWFVASAWWYRSCSDCSSCSASLSAVSVIPLPGFSVSDSSWNISSPFNLRFGKSGSTPVLSAKMTSVLDSIAQYTINHPTKAITVTGHYKSDEVNSTSFENLGLARADELKKWLIAKGVPEASIPTRSIIDESLLLSPADTVVGGISLAFATVIAEPIREALFQPHTVYFSTNQNTLPVDTVFTNYIAKAKVYLETHNDKKLQIVGHTDNVGDTETNRKLSANRAAFVKSELMKKGIAADKMESSGKGMDDPIADNTTEEGRAKNRRVTIQLQ
jgi:OmpA-OmpF porin, OOP family